MGARSNLRSEYTNQLAIEDFTLARCIDESGNLTKLEEEGVETSPTQVRTFIDACLNVKPCFFKKDKPGGGFFCGYRQYMIA